MSDFKLFLDAILREDEKTVRNLYRKRYIHERQDGATVLQFACSTKNVNIVRFLLSEGCDIEAKSTFQLNRRQEHDRPIHMAARNGSVTIVKELIERGCSINAVNKRGQTPLDVAMEEGFQDCARILKLATQAKRNKPTVTDVPTAVNDIRVSLDLLKNNNLNKIIDRQNGKTILDTLIANGDAKIIEAIKSKSVDLEEIKEWTAMRLQEVDSASYQLLHECLLFRCITQNFQLGFYMLCTPEIVNRDSLFLGPTALETAVEFGRVLCVRHILRKLLDVDESWTRAENMAMKLEIPSITALISDRRKYIINREKNGYSRLHIAVFDDEPDLIRYILLNKLVDRDEGQYKVGSALSLSYSLYHSRCIQCLLDNGANVNIVDRFNQGTLQVAIANRVEDNCQYLVDHTIDIEAKDNIGRSTLVCSVFNDCEKICEKIIEKGVQLDRYINLDNNLIKIRQGTSMLPDKISMLPVTNQETLATLCIKVNGTIYPCILDILDQQLAQLCDGNGNTLLHLAAVCLIPKICEKIIPTMMDVDLRNNRGDTALLLLLTMYKDGHVDLENSGLIETVTVLVDAGSNLNICDTNGCSALDIATEYQNENLLLALIRKREQMDYITDQQWANWIQSSYFTLMQKVIPLISRPFSSQWITIELIESTLLLPNMDLTKTLYDTASTAIQRSVVEKILYKAATIGDKGLFEDLVKDKLSLDISLSNGETLLTGIIRDRNHFFYKLTLKSPNGTLLLNKKNRKNQLPLHVCIETDYWGIIDELIFETTSFKDEDNEGNTALSLLMSKLSSTEEEVYINQVMSCIKMLISRNADIHKENKFKRKPIDECTNDDLVKDIISFYQRHQIQELENSIINRSSKLPPTAPTLPLCPICITETINCSLACGHMFCSTCAHREIRCYICRRTIKDIRKLHY